MAPFRLVPRDLGLRRLGRDLALSAAATGVVVTGIVFALPSEPDTGALSNGTPDPSASVTLTPAPTADPTTSPTGEPSPTDIPTDTPSGSPTKTPSASPTKTPSETPSPTDDPTADPEPGEQPNFVVILTDDQRADDMAYMPFTNRLLGEHGVTFTDALSPHPLCCPARAELVTGQYGQNSGVTHNSGPTGGFEALLDSDNTLPVWLQEAGYATAVSGKYLNGWKPHLHARPAGWTHWNPSVQGIYSFTNTLFYNDGKRERQRRNTDDAIVDYTNDYIREFAAADQPFYVQATALAPHVYVNPRHGSHYAIPAKRHQGKFAGARNPARDSPAFRKPIVDGPVSPDPGLTPKQLQHKFETRIESLQAVDEGVKSIVATLRETGELDNTYIVFASDNGNHLGEHFYFNKNTVFEESLKIPMLVRVPAGQGGGAARTSDMPVTLVDLPATIADLAGVTPGRLQDGVSFAPLLAGQDQPWRDTQLVQTGTDLPTSTDPGWDTRGVRTARWTYSESPLTGMAMLFDRDNDPAQTVNLAARPRYAPVVADLSKRLDALRTCSGAGCSRTFGPDPRPAA